MSKNWSPINLDFLEQPRTVDEAVTRLLRVLSAEERLILAVMDENELTNLHYSLGTSIRNAFELHIPDSPLLADCAVTHPDDASHVIIKALWQRLQ